MVSTTQNIPAIYIMALGHQTLQALISSKFAPGAPPISISPYIIEKTLEFRNPIQKQSS